MFASGRKFVACSTFDFVNLVFALKRGGLAIEVSKAHSDVLFVSVRE